MRNLGLAGVRDSTLCKKRSPEKYPGEYLALAVIKLISSPQLHIHATRVSQLLSQAGGSKLSSSPCGSR